METGVFLQTAGMWPWQAPSPGARRRGRWWTYMSLWQRRNSGIWPSRRNVWMLSARDGTAPNATAASVYARGPMLSCGASPVPPWCSSSPSSLPSTTALSPGTTSSWCTTKSGRSGTKSQYVPSSSSSTRCSLCPWRCLWLCTPPWCRCRGPSANGGRRCETWRRASVVGPVGSWDWRTALPTA